MNELEKPLTGQELVDLLMWVVIETVDSVSPSSKQTDERLEDIASHFLDHSRSLPQNPRLATLLKALAGNLVQTEEGAG